MTRRWWISDTFTRLGQRGSNAVPKPLLELLAAAPITIACICVALYAQAGVRGATLLWSIPAGTVAALAGWSMAKVASHRQDKRH